LGQLKNIIQVLGKIRNIWAWSNSFN